MDKTKNHQYIIYTILWIIMILSAPIIIFVDVIYGSHAAKIVIESIILPILLGYIFMITSD